MEGRTLKNVLILFYLFSHFFIDDNYTNLIVHHDVENSILFLCTV